MNEYVEKEIKEGKYDTIITAYICPIGEVDYRIENYKSCIKLASYLVYDQLSNFNVEVEFSNWAELSMRLYPHSEIRLIIRHYTKGNIERQITQQHILLPNDLLTIQDKEMRKEMIRNMFKKNIYNLICDLL